MQFAICKQRSAPFYILMVAVSLCGLVTGCKPHITSLATVRPGFDSYEKVAILWQQGRDEMQEAFFTAYWMDNFPGQTVVERVELMKIINEQDLLPNRLNEKTRARMRNVLGVRALILVSLRTQDRGRYIIPREIANLSIKVIDTETGEVAVSAVSEGRDRDIRPMIIESIRFIKEKAIDLIYKQPIMF